MEGRVRAAVLGPLPEDLRTNSKKLDVTDIRDTWEPDCALAQCFWTFSGTSRTIRMVFRSNLENRPWVALGKPRAALGALGRLL